MPYDPAKAKNILKIAGAYEQHPLGEIIKGLAESLREAEVEIKTAGQRAADAETRLNKAETELESAQAAVRRLRDGSSGLPDAIAALQSIALNPKGAAGVAKTALAKINGPATAVPA